MTQKSAGGFSSNPLLRRLLAVMPSSGRSVMEHANPGNAGADTGLDPWRNSGLALGFVTSSFSPAGTCQVSIPHVSATLPCVLLGGVCGYTSGYGVTESSAVTEGSHVIVWRPTVEAPSGFILGIVPPMLVGKAQGSKQLTAMADMEPAAGFQTEDTQNAPFANTAHANTLAAPGGRPTDDLPGVWSMLSEHGVGIRVGLLMTAMRAGPDAAIELSVLDGLVRTVARHLQVFRSDGELQAYSDHGMATMEYFGSPFAHEVDGVQSPDAPRTTETSADMDTLTQAALKDVAPQLCTIGRMQFMLGYLSSCFHFNVMSPAAGGTRTLASRDTDTGMCQLHVDDSGRMRVTSVSDIVLERNENIAVPKKTHEPWDPAGTRAEQLTPEKKKGFEWEKDADRKEGVAAALHADDGLAWDKRMDMLRMSEAEGDYFLPEERDVPPPKNDYGGKNPNTNQVDGEELFEAYRGRRCILRLGRDGTILLRANDGAEVFLRGDDLRVDTPGNLYLNAGKSVVVQAGHDIVMRAKNSVDVSATDHDVRLKAQRNLHMHSARSVLVESAADSDNPGDWPKEAGEDVQHDGVVIKAAKSRVLLDGDTTHVSAKKRIILESLSKELCTLVIRVGAFYALARRTWLLARSQSGKTASVALSGGSAILHGPSCLVTAESSVMLTRGSEAAIIERWGKLKTNPAAQLTRSAGRLYRTLFDSDSWLGQLGSQAFRDKMVFTFRKLRQLRLPDPFKIASGFWAYVRKKKQGDVGEWEEKKVNDTYPWPAKENHEGGDALLLLDEETNVDASSRLPKSRSGRKTAPGSLTKTNFSKFPYRK